MSFFKMVFGALIGGAIGAAVWCLVSYSSGYEVGWIAWGIGVLTGLGVRMAAQNNGGLLAGLVAGAVALLAIGAGKYATVALHVDKAIGNVSVSQVTDEALMVPIADQVVEEFTKKRKRMTWPAGKTVEDASRPEDYPKDVWTEAKKRFEALPKDDLEKRRDETRKHQEELIGQIKGALHDRATSSMFSQYDALWGFLALASAFRIGGGGED
jgi:hypothetical protein